MNELFLHQYAQIILKIGLDLKEGESLSVTAEPCHWPFLNILAEEAYKMKAKYVDIATTHQQLTKTRANFSSPQYLEHVPELTVSRAQALLNEKYALLYLTGPEDPDLLSTANPESLKIMTQGSAAKLRFFNEARSLGAVPWCIAPAPTAKWAAKVLNCEPTSEAIDNFWNVLVPIMRLDAKDPLGAWQEHSRTIKKRCAILQELDIDTLHFKGTNTDLKIGLMADSLFQGGSSKTQAGRDFFPNMPTEEIFTTPDFRRTEGKVVCTRPVTVLGVQVEGAWFEFKNGKVTNFGAKVGQEILGKYLETDAYSNALGEVALVDISSPIYQSNQIFHNILIDENATSHIAFGFGFPFCLKNGTEMSREERTKVGVNPSNVHLDFMIGNEQTNVVALLKNGSSKTIMENGRFTI